MHNILIISSKEDNVEELASELKGRNYQVLIVCEDEKITKVVEKEKPVVLLLDIRSGKEETLRACQALKKEIGIERIPTIALTTAERMDGLDFSLGIDDFIVEPYTSSEIAARIRLMLWRTSKIDSKDVIKIGDLVINLVRCEVSIKGKIINLTLKEYELLKLLATNKGRVFTRDFLLDRVWDYDYYVGARTVDVHIRRLRAKIEQEAGQFIKTVRGMGYVLDE